MEDLINQKLNQLVGNSYSRGWVDGISFAIKVLQQALEESTEQALKEQGK